MVNQKIIINVDTDSPREYVENLHFSLTEIMKMAFSQREVDLRDQQTLALWYLADFLQKLVSDPACK